MPETSGSSPETSEGANSQMASEGALQNLRSEILKQISVEVTRQTEDDQSGFTKYYTKGSIEA